jgi:hypothetical protein
MLGYKVAHVEVVKFATDEEKRMQQERTALLGELEESLNPELALQIKKIIHRRSLSGLDVVQAPRPKPALEDSIEAEEARNAAQEVCIISRLHFCSREYQAERT